MIQEFLNSIKANPQFFIVVAFIFIAVFGFSTISGYIVKKRIGFASKFGKLEHNSGRLLGFLLACTGLLVYFNEGISFVFIAVCVCFFVWFVYLLSHTFEKLLYGHSGPRG